MLHDLPWYYLLLLLLLHTQTRALLLRFCDEPYEGMKKTGQPNRRQTKPQAGDLKNITCKDSPSYSHVQL